MIGCAVPRCPHPAVPGGRGRCAAHRQTTTERGYGREHQDIRAALSGTLPAPCGYCGVVIRAGERWVAAHRVDGQPQYGYVVSHGVCNERAKGRAVKSLEGGDPRMTHAPFRERYSPC